MASPLGPNRKHPCPRTRWPAYQLQPVSSTMASLYGVCWKEVDNLLNRTLLAVETSGSTKQVWGYWNKTRSTVDSGGLSIPCMISITNIFQPTESPLISPYHAIPDITVPTETGDKLIPTQGRGFSRFPAGMHARLMRVIIITSVSITISMKINNMYPCI